MNAVSEEPNAVAAHLVAELTARGLTLATAESLTGGLLAGAVTTVPGSSAVLRGGAVTYATDVKASVLGVDTDLLERVGAVDAEVAAQMATGARRVFGADLAVATTGVAGPTEQDGQPVGTVFVGIVGDGIRRVERLALSGSRAEIREATVGAALALVVDLVLGPAAPEQPAR
jgi:nicotinamide-nucleotide amidase